ncbi:hypothetical protein MtrunA17_Chr2g0308141 [Medicago truncatula]|uniref:Uncharacterized protein n=1 Tax=Medicago truncatula TaxID=3880 RepID=A0A396J7P2_MEDTR|nr:hypothetical protein MtrunA17_Chr2g0308141 [Medicago truncatula]
MASSDDRDTVVKRLRHLGRKLSKNLASSADMLLELLDVTPKDLDKLQNISHHSRNMETTSSSIGAFLIDFYQLPSFSPGFHSIPQGLNSGTSYQFDFQ